MVDLMKNATILIPIDFSTWPDKPINQQKPLEIISSILFQRPKLVCLKDRSIFNKRSNGPLPILCSIITQQLNPRSTSLIKYGTENCAIRQIHFLPALQLWHLQSLYAALFGFMRGSALIIRLQLSFYPSWHKMCSHPSTSLVCRPIFASVRLLCKPEPPLE